MLIVANNLGKLHFGQLMAVYEEGNRENGAEFWPELPEYQQILNAENEFFQYLQEVFFAQSDAVTRSTTMPSVWGAKEPPKSPPAPISA